MLLNSTADLTDIASKGVEDLSFSSYTLYRHCVRLTDYHNYYDSVLKHSSPDFHASSLDSVDEDPATLTPEISLRSSGGQVEVVWNKGSQEGVEIQKDSGNGQWTFLALDTRPNYIDTTPMPASSAKWKYRAIYSNDAQRTGQWPPRIRPCIHPKPKPRGEMKVNLPDTRQFWMLSGILRLTTTRPFDFHHTSKSNQL